MKLFTQKYSVVKNFAFLLLQKNLNEKIFSEFFFIEKKK